MHGNFSKPEVDGNYGRPLVISLQLSQCRILMHALLNETTRLPLEMKNIFRYRKDRLKFVSRSFGPKYIFDYILWSKLWTKL